MENALCLLIDEGQYARWWLWAPGREHHFRSIADGIPELISLVKPTGEVEIANSHTLAYFDATLEDLKGRSTDDTVHPDDLPTVIASRKRAAQTGQPYNVKGRHRRADGAYRWFDMHCFPLLDTEERVAYWFLLERDVDDRRRAEALLAGEKRLLEMIATGESLSVTLGELCLFVQELCTDCVGCSILILDPQTQKLWHAASPRVPKAYTEAIDGFTIGPEVSSCGAAAFHGKQVVASDIATDSRWDEFREVALANGLRACWSTPVFSKKNQVLGTFAMFSRKASSPTMDDQEVIAQITHLASIAIERNQEEESLRRSRAYLSEAQRLSSTGSFGWLVSIDDHYWSDETFRIFEYDPSTKVSIQLVLDRAHPQDVHFVRQAMVLAAEGKDFDYECRFLMPGGAVKYLHIVAHRSRDPNDRLEYVGAVQDVTERRLSEEVLGKLRSELAHMARVTSLGALTASIAHEVSQPLSGIITNASTCLRMLSAEPPNVAGALETVRRTIRDGNRASDVITRLRALFGNKAVMTEPVDLNGASREVVALSASELQRNGTIVRLEFAEGLPFVAGDRIQLQQVILNLLLNASDAMSGIDDRPRQVIIRTGQDEGDRVRLTVQDAGIGFEPESLERLFEAFYTTKSGGMGIGLSISRSIIESHHGRLWASANEGPGATLSFSIPRDNEGVMLIHRPEPIHLPAQADTTQAARRP
jgi:PAS domain S-box-containing protein